MSELRIVVQCNSMLISTQFFRFGKAVEHFYYALLFSSKDYAKDGAAPWNSWVKMGFHLANKEPPSGVRDSDRLIVDSLPGKAFEVRASCDNRQVLLALSELLGEVDRARNGLKTKDEAERLKALQGIPAVESHLLKPVRESLERSGVSVEGREAVAAMIDRGLSALTNWQIQSVKVTVN